LSEVHGYECRKEQLYRQPAEPFPDGEGLRGEVSAHPAVEGAAPTSHCPCKPSAHCISHLSTRGRFFLHSCLNQLGNFLSDLPARQPQVPQRGNLQNRGTCLAENPRRCMRWNWRDAVTRAHPEMFCI